MTTVRLCLSETVAGPAHLEVVVLLIARCRAPVLTRRQPPRCRPSHGSPAPIRASPVASPFPANPRYPSFTLALSLSLLRELARSARCRPPLDPTDTVTSPPSTPQSTGRRRRPPHPRFPYPTAAADPPHPAHRLIKKISIKQLFKCYCLIKKYYCYYLNKFEHI